jgi:polyhydroxyalkanoate synthesis regulator phasin
MPGDDLFKRYLEIGASVLGMSRERAEGIVRDLVASGEVAKGQATKAADWLVERGRTGTEELAELVRREIRQQVTALGLATNDALTRLQAEIDELRDQVAATGAPTGAAAAPVEPAAPGETSAPAKAAAAAAKKSPANKAPAAAKKSPARKAPAAAKKAPVKNAPAAAKKAPAKKVAPESEPGGGGATTSAGITRSASVRKRPGASSSPAGGADPTKG